MNYQEIKRTDFQILKVGENEWQVMFNYNGRIQIAHTSDKKLIDAVNAKFPSQTDLIKLLKFIKEANK